jgi:hypothetical protein
MKSKLFFGSLALALVVIMASGVLVTQLQASPPAPLPTNIAVNRAAPGDAISASSGGYYEGPVGVLSNVAIAVPTNIPTSIPGLIVDSRGALGNIIEARQAGTPVWGVTSAGAETLGMPYALTNYFSVAAPTAVATAVPAVLIDGLGVSRRLEVRDATWPDFGVDAGGAVKVTAPTAIATAQPALSVDSLGVSRLFEVRDAATPVVAVNNGGKLWVGKGLQSAIGSIACTHGAALPDFSAMTVISVTASGTPTPNDFTVAPAGSIAILLGPLGSDTCTLTKGAKMALGGATRVLGANDSIMLVSDGTSWNEVAYTAGATS